MYDIIYTFQFQLINRTWTAFWKRWQNKLKTMQASSSLNVLSSSQKNSTIA